MASAVIPENEKVKQVVPETTLPSFFPLVLPACKTIAESFFECFDKNSLEECKLLMGRYESCMVKAGIEGKTKLVRVPDPYKVENR